jgi:hypothetical protein
MKKLIAFLCCLGLILGSVACSDPEQDNAKDMATGEQIINALNLYNWDHGEYPIQLSDLSPQYLAELPKTIENKDFAYHLDKLEGYYLCFGTGNKGKYGCCYNRRLESWDCTPGD